jgi:hypothetical protein
MQIVSRERAHGNDFLNVSTAGCQSAADICYSFFASGELSVETRRCARVAAHLNTETGGADEAAPAQSSISSRSAVRRERDGDFAHTR